MSNCRLNADKLSRLTGFAVSLLFVLSLSLLELPDNKSYITLEKTKELSFSLVEAPLSSLPERNSAPYRLKPQEELKSDLDRTKTKSTVKSDQSIIPKQTKIKTPIRQKNAKSYQKSTSQHEADKSPLAAKNQHVKRAIASRSASRPQLNETSGHQAQAQGEVTLNARHTAKELALKLSALLKSKLEYPNRARRRGIEGAVLLEFFLTNGTVSAFKIKKGSGNALLDDAAVKAAEKVVGCDLFEVAGLKTVEIPVRFELKN